jgi:hypothetical protein
MANLYCTFVLTNLYIDKPLRKMKSRTLSLLLLSALFLGSGCSGDTPEEELPENPTTPQTPSSGNEGDGSQGDSSTGNNGNNDNNNGNTTGGNTGTDITPTVLTFPTFENAATAFPGAEGYGREATGARGSSATIYHVTNLNASGTGSFADAISQTNRVVVFDVSGVINLNKSTLVLKSNQTILGQTAPGSGVVLYNGRISSSGATNLIVRYLRIRMGRGFGSDKDACGLANGSKQIWDHCSVSWGRDENFSINTDNKGTRPQNITIQNSIIAQGLQNHSCGGLIQTNTTEGITLFRNLYIDNKTRNPKVKGLNQFVNNVVYNWGSGGAYIMGGDSSGESETTIENNYFIVGPVDNYQNVAQSDGTTVTEKVSMSAAKPFTGGNADFRSYCVGNYYDKNKDGVLNGEEITQSNWSSYCSGSPTFLAQRSSLHKNIVGQTTAKEAYDWIVAQGGASLPARDPVDDFLINQELKSLGTKGTIIQDERNKTQFALGGPGTLTETKRSSTWDTDNDGIPDTFEEQWNLNKNDASDAWKVAENGYTNLENYVLSLEYPSLYENQYNAWKKGQK